jgi:hypothetical protein
MSVIASPTLIGKMKCAARVVKIARAAVDP